MMAFGKKNFHLPLLSALLGQICHGKIAVKGIFRCLPDIFLKFDLGAAVENDGWIDGRCYKDETVNGRRVLPLHAHKSLNGPGHVMTVEICKRLCFEEKDYKYAGVQWFEQCFCGNDQPSDSLIL